ncbi:hypothetical protein LZ023_35060 (plasmid) [Pseudomonas silvicola]|nr:hypothetical protein LZ023_35060 [Pseudomonas silvicola]
MALNFFYQTGDYGYTLWLPSILKNLTGTNMAGVGLLAAIPFDLPLFWGYMRFRGSATVQENAVCG